MTSRRSTSLVLMFLCFVLAPSFPSRAELPLDAYKTLQKTAPESLVIEVATVQRLLTQVTVHATVKSVERSASGLKAGDTLRICYELPSTPDLAPGPAPMKILKKGRSYPAFLAKEKHSEAYSPVAYGRSFEKVE